MASPLHHQGARLRLWRGRSGAVEGPRPAPTPPAALVVRHLRKAIGAPGSTALAAGVAVGLVLGLILAAALLAMNNRDAS